MPEHALIANTGTSDNTSIASIPARGGGSSRDQQCTFEYKVDKRAASNEVGGR